MARDRLAGTNRLWLMGRASLPVSAPTKCWTHLPVQLILMSYECHGPVAWPP